MILTNKNAQDFVAKCMFGKDYWEQYKQFVIPRKGNFLNPQYLTETDTYVVYYITRKVKRIMNISSDVITDEQAKAVHYATLKIGLDLQFIGQQAEEWANSTLFWDERTDVQKVMSEYRCQLLLGDGTSRSIVTVPFQQGGYNGEMSYLASLSMIQTVTLEEVKELWTSPVVFLGGLKVEK